MDGAVARGMSELDETEAGRLGVKGTVRERQVLEAREMATNYVAMGGEVWMCVFNGSAVKSYRAPPTTTPPLRLRFFTASFP
ncbi:hypothetical protein M404DRAFT_999818 [Pisolithus tinctorius Marx 270]|uniref:Uncharacterized protein n=1 Tax=Pisolithus tinctorius Marx 270 TaxID=870435 RepID=A0A0C3J861_PISTI|nr:hypothetical protein M404DRAFT_999818 [Pisolithus tinctorius Marx 270]